MLKLSAGNPLARPVSVYTIVYVLATVTSINPWLSLWGVNWKPQGTITTLCVLIFFLSMAETLRTKEQVNRMTDALLLGSVPVAVYGLAQYFGLDPLGWITDSVSSILSTMGRSNFLGAYLAMVIPFTLFRIVTKRGYGWSLRYTLVLILQVICLLLTWARAAWLSFLGGCLVFLCLLAWRWRSWVLLAISIVVLIAGSWLFALMNHTSLPRQAINDSRSSGPSFDELRTASVDRRFIIWRSTLTLIPARWLLGYGPETFVTIFSSRYPPGSLYEGTDVLVDDPHNLILNQLMAIGLVGLLAFLEIIVRFYGTVFDAFSRGMNRWIEAITAATLGSATAFLIQAQFNPQVIVLVVLFWIVLAFGVVVHRWDRVTPSC